MIDDEKKKKKEKITDRRQKYGINSWFNHLPVTPTSSMSAGTVAPKIEWTKDISWYIFSIDRQQSDHKSYDSQQQHYP